MTKSFNKGVVYGLVVIAIIFSSVLIACNKSDLSQVNNQVLTKEQLIMKEKFSDLKETIGEVDMNTVKSVNNGDKKLYVLTAKVKGSKTKKIVLLVDERISEEPKFFKSLFDSNIPTDFKKEDYNSFNGYLEVSSLEKNNSFVRIEFVNGIKVENRFSKISKVSASTNSLSTTEKVFMLGDPIGNCVNKVINNLSLGEAIIFLATFPDSYALVLLACILNTVIIR